MNVGATELLVVLVILLLLFGGSRIPELARSLGRAHREFRDGLAAGEAGTNDEERGTQIG